MRRMFCAGFVALIIAGGAVAAPASAAKLASFSGTGTGYALRVTLDLRNLMGLVPALQPIVNDLWETVELGGTPGLLDQTFIKTSSDASGSSHKATSVLAEGLIDLDSLEATKIGDSLSKVVQTLQIPSAEMPLIDGGIGTLKAAIPSANGVNGSGVLESVKVGVPLEGLGLEQLTALLDGELLDGLTTELEGVLDGVLGSGNTALVAGLTDTIDGLATTLPAGSPVLGGLTSGLGLGSTADLTNETAVTEALSGPGGLLDVDALVGQLTGLLRTNLLNGAIADLSGLINITKSGKTGEGLAIADSAATLKKLNVLGGLVDVSLLNLDSHSEAAGVAGSAKNSSSCSLGDVKIGGDAVALGFDGKTIYLNGQPVPVVGGLVGQVKDVVDDVLNVLGIEVGLCENSVNEAATDGSAAANRVSALRVKVAPLDLFSLVIDPTVETQAAAQVQGAPVVDEVDPPLPRTGPAAVATVLSGIGLAGVALFARKRFFAR